MLLLKTSEIGALKLIDNDDDDNNDDDDDDDELRRSGPRCLCEIFFFSSKSFDNVFSVCLSVCPRAYLRNCTYLGVGVLVLGGGGRDAEVEESYAGVELGGDVVVLAARPADGQRHVALGRLGAVRRRLVRPGQADVAQRPQPVTPHPVRPRRQLALRQPANQQHSLHDFVTTIGKKGKVFPYSLPSVGPGADPGVQAVSPQVT